MSDARYEILLSKEEDIKQHPERHRHTMDDLVGCCMVDGVLSLMLMDIHHQYANVGVNGGRKCDVIEGPCACGAWHQ